MNNKIFISYSRQDKVCSNYISNFLKVRGFDVWIDTESIALNSNWVNSIKAGIEESMSFIAILSSNSVKREEVLKEIEIAFEKNEKDEEFGVYFISIGDIHKSWFTESKLSKRIIEYLEKYQYIKLDSLGRVTSNSMKILYNSLLNGKPEKELTNISNNNCSYIYDVFVPKLKVIKDGDYDITYYKCQKFELSPSTAFILSLDNQWLPYKIMSDDNLAISFYKSGFASDIIKKIIDEEKEANFLVSLINHRQIIINRANILSSDSLNKYFIEENDKFLELLKNGSLIILLYESGTISPYISKEIKYGVNDFVKEKWNDLCRKIPIYVIRENWDNISDQHSVEIAKFCSTLGFDEEMNNAYSSILNIEKKNEAFSRIIKMIGMEVNFYVNSTGNDIENINSITGFSRSKFYEKFVTISKSINSNAIKDCLFDKNKIYHYELKQIIDSFYNTMLINSLHCDAVFPINDNVASYLLYQLFLKKSEKSMTIDEIKYVFDEFLYIGKNNSIKDRILNDLLNLNDNIYIEKWYLDSIVEIRNSEKWREYIDFLELLIERSRTFRVFFDQLEEFVEKAISIVPNGEKNDWEPSVSFRICIGESIIIVVMKKSFNQLKILDNNKQNIEKTNVRLKIDFQIGDLLSTRKIIFDPICLFNGSTIKNTEKKYLSEIKEFFQNHNFIDVED